MWTRRVTIQSAKQNEEVDARIKRTAWQFREASKPGRGQGTGRDENEPAVVFGPVSPADRTRERASEAQHVEQWNDQELFLISEVERVAVEEQHRECG